jgi:hypothetical protein
MRRTERQAWLRIARGADRLILDTNVGDFFVHIVFQADDQIVKIDVRQADFGDRRRLVVIVVHR